MSAPATPRYTFSASIILLVASLLCFIAAFCVTQDWLTLLDWQAWIAAGLALHVTAELA